MTKGLPLEQLFRRVVADIEQQPVRFAVAGAIAASIYRRELRATQDLDFAIASDRGVQTIARQIVERQGLEAKDVRRAQLDGGPLFAIKRRSTPVVMICGRKPHDPDALGVDFILPGVPWVVQALERAQSNAIDYGFGPVPTLTVEDVIIAKVAAFSARSDRFKDLDDLQSIFAADHALDLPYLASRLRELELAIPKPLHHSAPPPLVKLSRTIERERRRSRKQSSTELG